MFDKPQATHTLGLDLDGPSLKGVALSFSRGKPKLDSAFELSVEPPSLPTEFVKPLYMEQNKEELLALAHNHLVVTSLNAHEVLVRPLDLKIKKVKDIDTILAFQSEPLLPYPIENALVDKIILSKDKENSKLTILAARKDHLTHHIQQWNSLDIEPEDITAAPAALAVFVKNFTSVEGLLYVLHLGIANSLCILTQNGKLIAAQAIPKGTIHLAAALAQDKNINLEEARQQLKENQFKDSQSDEPALKEAVEILRLDLTRTIFGLAKQAKGQDVGEILITGEGSTLTDLTNVLCRPLNKTLLVPQEKPGFDMHPQELQKFALPIGAAMSALPKSQEQINFRQQEFAYPAPWKRLKKPVTIYLFLCLGIAVSLILFGKAYLSYQEAELKRQYLDLLNVMNKPYSEFEKQFAVKNPSGRDLGTGEVLSIESMTQDEIKSRLNFLEKELQSMPQSYPLQPNMPQVSDVLAWIATHPTVVPKAPSGEKNPPALQIENFTYTMLKRPELAKKQEKFQVKVEIEFSSPTPKMAREFHDALIAPNDIVDPKGEVKWSSNRDKYRTSFYLKDKTVYPNP